MPEQLDREVVRLFEKLRTALPRLERLLLETDRWSGREAGLAQVAEAIVAELRALAPDRPLNRRFAEVIDEMHEDRWAEGSQPPRAPERPAVNAFLQARFFLQLAVHCAKENLEGHDLPAGTGALLRLYEE